MTDQAILYALSTISQTCAALAALVGALGVYHIQSLKERHAVVEQNIRSLIIPHRAPRDCTADLLTQRARAFVADQSVPREVTAPVTEALVEWDAFDTHFRRSKRLLAFFIGWNLVAIFLSLGGFAFVYRLMNHWSSWVGVWVVAGLTVAATSIMLLEVHGSLDRFRTCRGLGWILGRLENRHG